MLALRPYQQEALEAILNGFTQWQKLLAVLPTGSGKTILFSHLAAAVQPARTLVLAHREELLTQAIEKIRAATGLRADMEKAEWRASMNAPVVVASIQTMLSRGDRWPVDHFGLVVVDECFVAGTKIDGRPIETLRPGDYVTGLCHRQKRLLRCRVLSVSRRRPSALMTLKASNGATITCTPNHPVFTGEYVPAGQIQIGTELLTYENDRTSEEDLPLMRQSCSKDSEQQTHVLSEGSCLLLPELLECLQGTAKFGYNGGHESQVCVGANEGQQSNENDRGARENEGDTQDDWPSSALAGRQWEGVISSGVDPVRGTLLLLESGRSNKETAWPGIPDSLQNRFGLAWNPTWNRGGWGESLLTDSPGTRQEERGVLAGARLDGIEIHQPTSDGRFGGVCRDGFVYNLEVERTANYFANGILVHNCHHALADSYCRVLARFDGHAKVLGVTATPDRGDRKNLGKYFEEIAYEIGLPRLIRDGYLSRIVAQRLPVGVDLRGVGRVAGDLKAGELGDAIEPRLMDVAEAMAGEAWDRKTIVFLPLVSLARKFAGMLAAKGIEARAVAGEDNADDRRKALGWFAKAGAGSALCNAMLLTEGFDQPDVDCVVCLRPTQVRSLYAQMVGRGTRIHPGKEHLLLLDFLWQTDEHKLVSAARLVCEKEEDVQAVEAMLASKSAGGDGEQLDLLEASDHAESARLRKVVERLKEVRQRPRTPGTFDVIEMCLALHEESLMEFEPSMGWHELEVTDKQAAALVKAGFDPGSISCRGHASKILDTLSLRRSHGLATPKQVRMLRRFNHPSPEKATFDEARAFIDSRFGAKQPTPQQPNRDLIPF